MKPEKKAELNYWLEHVSFWDAYHRKTNNPDADDTARLLGEIVRKIQGNL